MTWHTWHTHTSRAHWRKIVPTDASKAPRMRGGHQMCLDTERKRIYLFGGWDGHYDLDDLWVFDLTVRHRFKCCEMRTGVTLHRASVILGPLDPRLGPG